MNYVIQGQTLTGIADAIRAHLGTEQQYTPESMAAAIESIQGGKGTEIADSILDRSISGTYASRNLTIIYQNGLFGATHLTGFWAPKLSNIRLNAFISCNALKYFYASGEIIQSGALSLCNSLVAVILAAQSISNLQNASAFSGTPIESGTGYIYVPDDLVEQYKVATNWATYANQIKGLSEIPAEVQEWLDQQGGAA